MNDIEFVKWLSSLGTSTVTMTTPDEESEIYDINEATSKYKIGHHPLHERMLKEKFNRTVRENGRMVIREFTPKKKVVYIILVQDGFLYPVPADVAKDAYIKMGESLENITFKEPMIKK